MSDSQKLSRCRWAIRDILHVLQSDQPVLRSRVEKAVRCLKEADFADSAALLEAEFLPVFCGRKRTPELLSFIQSLFDLVDAAVSQGMKHEICSEGAGKTTTPDEPTCNAGSTTQAKQADAGPELAAGDPVDVDLQPRGTGPELQPASRSVTGPTAPASRGDGKPQEVTHAHQSGTSAGRAPGGDADGDLKSLDAFLCYNSDDQPVVRRLFEKLKAGGLTVWFDDESVAMGESFLRGIDKGLRSSSSMAVCVGPTGIGPWQREEIDAAQPLAVQGSLLVIPVLLPDAHDEPDLPIFLNHLRRVDFRSGFTDDGLQRLIGDIKKASDERHRGTKKP